MQPLSVRLARGEETAFAELYDACADRLHRYLTVRLRSWDQASDVLQTAMMRAVKSRRRFAKVDNPEAYLFQIARNESMRLAKRSAKHSHQSLDTAELMIDLTELRDDSEAVSIALDRLSVEDRELVELKIYAGLTFREIAEITNRPQPTVATRYRRALESMRPWLAKQFQD